MLRQNGITQSDYTQMNNLLSEGYLAAERFLVFQNLSHNQNLQKNLLTKELQGRSLDEWFFRDIEEEVERLEELPVKEWEDHLQLYQLHRRIYHHPSQSRRMQPGELTIVKMDEELDLLYLLEKAAIITEKTFRNRIIKNENHDIDRDLRLWQVERENINLLTRQMLWKLISRKTINLLIKVLL